MSASDANVAGAPKVNAGGTQAGVGEEVNVNLTGANVVIDAVVVKGGPAYNVYSSPASLPPTLAADQHYISPLNPGGRVPALSHWFICYHSTTPPPAGSLTIDISVDDPDGIPAVPLPSSYTVVVNCNDGIPAHHNDIVTIGAGGGETAGATITGIPSGTICTVVEQTTASLPAGATEGDIPAAAATTGIVIPAGAGVVVDVVDNLAADQLETGSVQLVKVLVPGAPPGLTLPSSYAAHASCDDGTEADVTLPGAGGNGSPIVTVPVLTDCLITEDANGFPPGWIVSYSVAGGTPSPTPPIITVASTGVTDVAVTNDPTAAAAPTSTTAPSVAPTMPGTLPPTGGGTPTPLFVGSALIAIGLGAIGYASNKRNTPRGAPPRSRHH
jgi:hypothetical protein